MVRSRKRQPAGFSVAAEREAPFLSSVDPFAPQLIFRCAPPAATPLHSASASMIEVTWPLATNAMLQNAVSDIRERGELGWSAMRLGKFYEALDALTGDVAHKHVSNGGGSYNLVTGGHYHSVKLARALPGVDMTLRCYITRTGSSSLEVRTDAVQVLSSTGVERLVNVCHTVMVATDPATGKGVKGAVPPLIPSGGEDEEAEAIRTELGELHSKIRSRRASEVLFIRDIRDGKMKLTMPPTQAEMVEVHELHKRAAASSGIAAHRAVGPDEIGCPDEVSEHTHTTSLVVFPEHRNVHGNAFGGFVTAHAFDLAYFAARFYTKGEPFAAIGLDEAVFLSPVKVGDSITFTARVVHAADATFRVFVTVGVLDTAAPHQLARRTNVLRFVFAVDPESPAAKRAVLPRSYREILMHVEAARRHAVEGPNGSAKKELLEYFAGMGRLRSGVGTVA